MAMSQPKLRSRWSYTTPFLVYTCGIYALADIFFGYDSGMFASLQALPSFLNSFGRKINGKQKLPTHQSAIMNSTVWVGKLIGTLCFEPLCERLGYRPSVMIICVVQCIAGIVEVTAKYSNWVAFTVGRCISYLASGMVENCAPSYNAELAPAPIRSMFSGSMVVFIVVGQLWANLMSRGFIHEEGPSAWRIIVSMQLIPPVIVMALVYTTPESPRWLVAHGKHDEALKALNRVRQKDDVDAGITVMEIDAFEAALEQSRIQDRGSWLDLFRGTYLRRSLITAGLFIAQQTNGSQFINSFGASFYISMGLGSKSFDYTCINSACIIVTSVIALYLYDKVGRRPVMVVSAFCMLPLMAAVSAIGSKPNPPMSAVYGVVACNIIFTCFSRMATDTASYVVCSEIGGVKMRRKIMAWATSWQVVSAFVITYISPYLIASPGLDLKAKVGYIWLVISSFAFVFILVCVPELKGRSLEEIDELFEKRLWAWQFAKVETTGVGAQIARLEGRGGPIIEDKGETEEDMEEKGIHGVSGKNQVVHEELV